MTDSSSKEDVSEMAAELINAKIDAARKESQLTHVLRIGSFHMEIVPDESIDIEKMFEKTLQSLMDRYDKELLVTAEGLISQSGKMYG
tara:strand:+ start:356 stop:619 length:264 start_codon:yes stop_codon:yes gene_type:complete